MKRLLLLLCIFLLLPTEVYAQKYEINGSSLNLPSGWQVDLDKAIAAKTEFYAEQENGGTSLYVEKIIFPDKLVANSYSDYSEEQKRLLIDTVRTNILKGNVKAQITSSQFASIGDKIALLSQAEDNSFAGQKTMLIQVLFLKNGIFYQLSFLTNDHSIQTKQQIDAISKSFN